MRKRGRDLSKNRSQSISSDNEKQFQKLRTVLLVDDDRDFLERFSKLLSNTGMYKVITAESWVTGREIFRTRTPNVVLVDYKLRDGYDGIDALKEIRENTYSFLVVIMVSAHLDENIILEAMRFGADQCISKHVSDAELLRRITEEIEKNMALRNMAIEEKKEEALRVEPVFISPVMKKVQEKAFRFMDLDENLLITGPTGSGKEVLARWIHDESVRCRGPYCVIGLPELTVELFKNELFGHEAGAYTGAEKRKDGLLELANDGTLVLDEIGDLRLDCQLALLRVMEGKSFRRLGGETDIHINVRFIALTNRDLEKEIEEEKFRQDLYFRLKTFHIELPPLRERKEDIPELAKQILKKVSYMFRRKVDRIDPDLEKFFLSYNWPGNVREMEEFIKNGVLNASSNVLRLDDVLRGVSSPGKLEVEDGDAINIDKRLVLMKLRKSREVFERKYLEELLVRYNGNAVEAARHAGVPRESFYRLCKKHGLVPSEYRYRNGDLDS